MTYPSSYLRPRLRVSAGLLAAALLALQPAAAADPAPLQITGLVARPLSLTMDDLTRLPQISIHVAFMTSNGPQAADYTGVPLWRLIETAGLNPPLDSRKTRAKRFLQAHASDGYEVVVALAEIDPDFEAKPVVIATTKDGKPLTPDQGFLLLVPGDKHGARSVYQLTSIDLR